MEKERIERKGGGGGTAKEILEFTDLSAEVPNVDAVLGDLNRALNKAKNLKAELAEEQEREKERGRSLCCGRSCCDS